MKPLHELMYIVLSVSAELLAVWMKQLITSTWHVNFQRFMEHYSFLSRAAIANARVSARRLHAIELVLLCELPPKHGNLHAICDHFLFVGIVSLSKFLNVIISSVIPFNNVFQITFCGWMTLTWIMYEVQLLFSFVVHMIFLTCCFGSVVDLIPFSSQTD